MISSGIGGMEALSLLLAVLTAVPGISCFSLGLISPIEVVEEWGCHDTEIRLTCGHLDSKLAILEATFTPNCTQEDCLRFDIQRLARVLSTPRSIDPRIAEAEAGRKFLETLRKTHPEDEDMSQGTDVEGDDEGALDVEGAHRGPHADHLVGDRASLRASLERLIIRYLRKLSPNEDLDYVVKRSVRLRRAVPTPETTERISLGERNITIVESDVVRTTVSDEDRYRTLQESRSACIEQKRMVKSLDRFDLEHSYKNESEDEYNIRKVLNRRCSGRNHCSFLFALDHPYSKVWDSGVVRVKYICMDDFRVNQYCNEHLTIGYEVAQHERMFEAEPTKGEPVAEARVQLQDQSYHSLKILKAADDVEELPDILNSASRKRKIKLQKPKSEEIKQQAGVYSQDFKVLKILPSNLDDFHDIEQIGDEIYFRKSNEILSAPGPTAASESRLTTRQAVHSTVQDDEDVVPSPHPTHDFLDRLQESSAVTFETANDYLDPPEPSQNISSKFENITLIIREGEQYIITFPSPRILDNFSVNSSSTTPHPSSTTTSANISTPGASSAASASTTETSFQTATLDEPQGRQNVSTTKYFGEVESSADIGPTEEDLSADASDNEYEEVDTESEDRLDLPSSFYIDEDEDSEEQNRISQRRKYHSIQRTFYGRPLLHGFAMSPGYPKFYIGEYECKLVLSAPIGQKIRVTILDLSLRYDCKDFVEIVDLDIGRNLYNSCSEAPRPVEIVSHSNQVEVFMKSTTKFAYPKRGLLLHYSALGCVSPPPPENGRLVNRTETAAFYECDESFVFPDTGVNRRQLVCTERHTWDLILPDCIEELAIAGSGLVSSFNLGSRKKSSDTTTSSSEMSDKEADLVYDIIIPAVLISGLFIINAIVFVIILRYRRRTKSLETESVELAQL